MVGDYASAGFKITLTSSTAYRLPVGIYWRGRDLNAAVIALKGSQEQRIQNWVEDLYWKQLDINYPGISVAMVHQWIYYAYHNTKMQLGTMDAVKRAKDLYGDINIMVTGHSIDGLWHPFGDLILWLYDIGFGSLVYEVKKVCDGSGEDPMCSRPACSRECQSLITRNTYGRLIKVCFCILVTGNSITDHLLYYGVELMAETWGLCKIIMDPRLKEYGSENKGNLMLLRNPSASALRLHLIS
ncbi:uncharacterized protein LOC104415068 [Eucalyptus grandis]|uniref:uncharacterized protein LOC104415068 n=1 Tax=Eucalyptus grandis TaxID=71139 RepID=UPI00192E8DBE|nr:uncharacterized protein LOC104415068 [Eucalyptus grandis]